MTVFAAVRDTVHSRALEEVQPDHDFRMAFAAGVAASVTGVLARTMELQPAVEPVAQWMGQ